jgi:16S rRNA (adenine1518-N6/adenine1519-N6)-dimethyltransferase
MGRRFGQHFLEPAWSAKVVSVIDPQPGDTFIEIGPGRGALTHPLAARAKAVIAVEIDRTLAAILRRTAPGNVTIVTGDFLDPAVYGPLLNGRSEAAGGPSLRVAGNLPYNVGSPILFKLAELADGGVPMADATVMLQREVADRLLAGPGSRQYGVLTVLIRHSATVERLLDLPRGAFRPMPKVRSAVVRLRFHPPDPPVLDAEFFVRLVKAAFGQRRKTIANALGAWLAGRDRLPAWVDARRRPETLSIAEFARLADDLRLSVKS